MTASLQNQFNQVLAQLQDDGLLLMSDLVYVITKERIRGSWWSHKLARTIFNISEMLEDHSDVMIMKLISGKVTFVHRELWNFIYSIGVAREEWQLKGLSPNGRRLLETLDSVGQMQTNMIGEQFGANLATSLVNSNFEYSFMPNRSILSPENTRRFLKRGRRGPTELASARAQTILWRPGAFSINGSPL